MRYLRNKKDGTIYEWNDILARNKLCEEVTEEQAYPERFLKAEVVAKAKAKQTKKGALDLSTADVPKEPAVDFSDDASKGLE